MTIRARFAILGAACLAFSPLLAQKPAVRFHPRPVPGGTLRIWGDRSMASVVQVWEERFRLYHPEVRFDTRLMGTDSAMPGLYGGVADLALFGRESNTTENDGFLHSLQYVPLRLHLMAGSLAAPGKSYAPVLFVSKDNPLRQLTLDQVDSVFGCGQPGHPTPARVWGDLGLGGEWKDKPIHLYTFDMESGTGTFVLQRLQGDSKKMNWKIIHEFRNTRHIDGTFYDAGQQTMDALRKDPYGLALSGLHYKEDGVRPLALAPTASSAYVSASSATVMDGTYPLARMTYVFVNHPPGKPVPALAKEFLRFIYSEEGQNLVLSEPGFLPLTPQDAARQRALLE